jgi:hypothetical protein
MITSACYTVLPKGKIDALESHSAAGVGHPWADNLEFRIWSIFETGWLDADDIEG